MQYPFIEFTKMLDPSSQAPAPYLLASTADGGQFDASAGRTPIPFFSKATTIICGDIGESSSS